MANLDLALPSCEVLVDLDRTHHGGSVAPSERIGVCWHYDASRTDAGAESWFRSKDFKLSYNRAYTDSGRRIRLTPSIHHVAYHAGICRTPPASSNRAYYGLCVTAGPTSKDGRENPIDPETNAVVTMPQFTAIVYDTALIFRWHGWPAADVLTRLVGHNGIAIFNKRDNPTRPDLWGKLGRKADPDGPDPKRPVLSLNSGRAAVSMLLDAPDHPIWERLK